MITDKDQKFQQELSTDVQFRWKKETAPIAFSNLIRSRDDLQSVLDNDQVIDDIIPDLFEDLDSRLSKTMIIWLSLVFVLVPLIWTYIFFRLVRRGFAPHQNVGQSLTLILLLLLCLTFILPGVYAIFKRRSDFQDVYDQIDLLRSVGTKMTSKEIIDYHLYDDEEGLKWKIYQVNWRISRFYPETTILDLSAVGVSIFSMIYLLLWIIRLTQNLITGSSNSVPLVMLTLLILIIFVLFLWSGYRFSSLGMYPRWDDPQSIQVISFTLGVLSIGIVTSLIIEILYSSDILVSMVLVLLVELPILFSFIINRINLFREYSLVKEEILEKIESQMNIQVELLSPDNDLSNATIFVYEILSEARRRILEQKAFPTSRLRSYSLILTAIISILVPFITAFATSVGYFEEIIQILSPW